MVYIEDRKIEELSNNDDQKIDLYLDRYIPFHQRFGAIDQRSIDKALWFYGKFLKATRFPIPVSNH